MSKLKLLYIDDDDKDRRVFGRDIKNFFDDSTDLELLLTPPLDTIDQMIEYINSEEIDCVIVDNKLYDSSDVTYSGFNLAEKIRESASNIPIYVLTGYTGDNNGWSVEDIIPKKNISDDDEKKKYGSRILRQIDSYHNILNINAKKVNELISKSIDTALSKEELEELNKLQNSLDLTTSSEAYLSSILAKENDKNEEILNKIDKILGELNHE